jgi:hypothetical protein
VRLFFFSNPRVIKFICHAVSVGTLRSNRTFSKSYDALPGAYCQEVGDYFHGGNGPIQGRA